jgi:hypothetical protein
MIGISSTLPACNYTFRLYDCGVYRGIHTELPASVYDVPTPPIPCLRLAGSPRGSRARLGARCPRFFRPLPHISYQVHHPVRARTQGMCVDRIRTWHSSTFVSQ